MDELLASYANCIDARAAKTISIGSDKKETYPCNRSSVLCVLSSALTGATNRADGITWFEVAHAARELEATMELMVRLNVLAALLSFGLIAAIVVGVV
ncbi:hypothetical protein [Hyphomicrobium sp. D-2]|uniref:hypothetical protein n=1 Tax=Hyphomicrobium sp. D-2 TaxID=3041621 RepID=UPI0024561D6D|nr:hypothetical protein [Hyphomicrobium sp. D-2]MDH4981501.1 hypothetical protein [Hyphomicrobium sp. D-2]